MFDVVFREWRQNLPKWKWPRVKWSRRMSKYPKKWCLKKFRPFTETTSCCEVFFRSSLLEIKKGMKYNEEWVLECILVRMRRPKLYEHLRRKNILTLPGCTCLNKAAQHFKSGFGFNPKVFTLSRRQVRVLLLLRLLLSVFFFTFTLFKYAAPTRPH